MICFITAALSADGYIARDSEHAAFWTSKDDKRRFVEITKRAGVVVMGLNTYTTLDKPLKDRLNIVYSPEKLPEIKDAATGKNILETTSKSPHELLHELNERGFKEVAICGGSQIYTMFMESGVVNKLYITIEPILFGAGIKLFGRNLDHRLILRNSTQTGDSTLLLEYDVI